jgi:AraC-like DNA-binding protein
MAMFVARRFPTGLGKTRMTTPPPPPALQAVDERPKGVVDPAAARRTFRLERYRAEGPFAAFLDHYWLVAWDLTGRPPYVQRTLPYPCVNLVFDAGKSGVFGVVRGAFEYRLEGRGCVLGLRFRPGAFRALLGRPVNTLTDRVLPLAALFGGEDAAHERAVLGAADDAGMIAAANALLGPRLPAPDPQVERLATLLRSAEQDRALTRAEQLAEQAGLGLRALQRLFAEYVGVSPKWVIRRYRLHDAADRLAQGDAVDLAALAQSLGYYDQAHFTRDFRKLVGRPPAEYRRGA